jgi:hypothetical protein
MITNDGMVVIPPAFEHLMGVPDGGTRIYRAEGNHSQMRQWFDGLCLHIGPCVSPGGAAIYAKVSRAAVYKRMKAGGLTAFCFKITAKTRTLFGNEKKLKELPLIYIPYEECKAWSVALDLRAARVDVDRGTAEDGSALDQQTNYDEENPSPVR